jgi:hypothetical protein
MKKFVLAALFAVAAIGITQAQTQQQQCCDQEAWVELKADIERILCIYPQCQPDGWVRYDCPPDFNGYQNFLQPGNDPHFVLGVWSNVEFDVSVHTHQTGFTKPNALGNAIPSSSVEFRVGATAGISDAVVQAAFVTLPFFPINTNGAPGNAINSADPTNGAFALNFRMKPLANPWQYTPGVHTLPVHITITAD